MKISFNKIFFLALALFTLASCGNSDSYLLENKVLNCTVEAYKENDIDFRAELLSFENYLIHSHQLKNPSGKSYLEVYKRIAETGSSELKVDYTISGLEYATKSTFTKCSRLIWEKEKGTSKSSKLSLLLNKFENYSPERKASPLNVAEDVLAVLDAEDFNHEFYKFYALQSFYHISSTESGIDRLLPPPK